MLTFECPPERMLSTAEGRLFTNADRQAMERHIEDLHRRLDEFEGELANYCSAGCGELSSPGSRPAGYPIGGPTLKLVR